MKKSDKEIKKEAIKKEHERIYNDMILPPRDIIAHCSDGIWIRNAWIGLNVFGWTKWGKIY